MPDLRDISEDHVHEEPQPPRPMIEYKAIWQDRKGRIIELDEVRGFQFDGGFYFLYIQVEGYPVPEIRVLDLSSPDVRNLCVTPINIIEPNG